MRDPAVLLASRDPRRRQWAMCGLRGLLDVLSTVQAETAGNGDDAAFDAFVHELSALLSEAREMANGEPPLPAATSVTAGAVAGAERAPGISGASGTSAPPSLAEACRQAVQAQLLARGIDARLPAELGDDAFWHTLQLLALALPPAAAEACRAALRETARSHGALADDIRRFETLPSDTAEPLYPGLAAPYNVPGLALAPTAPLYSRLGSARLPDDLLGLARIVSVLAWFAEEPRHRLLHHAYRPLHPFGLKPADGAYADALVKRFERVRAQSRANNPAEALRLRLELDEAIHSLTTMPPAARDSWWARLQQRARQTLDSARDAAIAAGHDVHWQVLSGHYADIYEFTRDDTNIDLDAGRPGEVLACLRVYARIDGSVLLGRVIYNPL